MVPSDAEVFSFELAHLPAVPSHPPFDALTIPRSEDGVSGKTHAHFGSNEFLRKESNKC